MEVKDLAGFELCRSHQPASGPWHMVVPVPLGLCGPLPSDMDQISLSCPHPLQPQAQSPPPAFAHTHTLYPHLHVSHTPLAQYTQTLSLKVMDYVTHWSKA